MLSRRRFLQALGPTLGPLAFSNLAGASPLAPRSGHHAAKARACIFLFMEGGPSHIDTFDPKPKLAELHMSEFTRKDRLASAMASGKRYFVKSPFQFHRVGRAGIQMNTRFEHLAAVADELCVYRGCQAESVDHPTACFQMNTGSRFPGDPAVGSWISYGLGTHNQNLPSFVVLADGAYPQGGSANWSSGFLPAHHQGTPLRPGRAPIVDLSPPSWVTRADQRANLDLLAKLNAADAARAANAALLEARMDAYELAFRMQTEVPRALSLRSVDARTSALYGLDDPRTESFGRRCLLARKLVEAGVRFVQIFEGGWDSHDDLPRSHGARIQAIDRPLAGLIKDLRARGLLDSTLLVWAGEFGRSPDNGVREGKSVPGRDHNARAMALWLAGGGARAGTVVGATDEVGGEAVEVVRPLRDLHVTILHLMGLDDRRLTYLHEGRWKQLSQVGGKVIRELVAG